MTSVIFQRSNQAIAPLEGMLVFAKVWSKVKKRVRKLLVKVVIVNIRTKKRYVHKRFFSLKLLYLNSNKPNKWR